MRKGLAAIRRHLVGPVALLALLAATLPAATHPDGLHAARAAAVESIDSGCAERHPPRWEALQGKHRGDCPACLLQLQRGTAAAPTAAAPHAPPPARLAIVAATHSVPPAPPTHLASPRGPPVLPG